MLTDAERMTKLEAMLRSSDEIHEFWFDPDAGIFFAGPFPGDTLRDAVDGLVTEEEQLPEPDPEPEGFGIIE